MTKGGFEGSMKFCELTRLQLICIWVRYFSLPWLPMLRRRFRHRKFIPPIDDTLLLMSATDLAKAIRTKQVSAVTVVQTYINRIKEVNPVLNALAGERYDAALKDAAKADDLCTELDVSCIEERYPLLGVPFSVKVTIGAEGLPIHAGVYSRRHIICDEDSVVVKNLRAAGAIPLCVTNVPEWGMSFESNNKIHGHTLNPYDTRRCPGGSSGGETSLIGAAASIFGIGTDFMGSCRLPAMFCGVFGHRSTRPLISNDGLVPTIPDPIVQQMLTIGVLCRYAKDLPVVLKAMAGPNVKMIDIDTAVDVMSLNVFYTTKYGKSSPEKIPIDQEILDHMTSVVQELSKAGIKTKEIAVPYDGLLDRIASKCMLIDSNHVIRISDIPPTNGAVIREYFKWIFGKSHHCLNAIHSELIVRHHTAGVDGQRQINNRKILDEYEKELKNQLGTNSVLLLPTFPTVAYHHYSTAVMLPGLVYLLLPSAFNLPATNVPLGLNKDGLPIGIQVIAGQYQDRLCFAVAECLERKFGGWTPPPSK